MKSSNDLSYFNEASTNGFNEQLQNPTEADKVAQALGEQIYARTLEMSPEEWAQAVLQFKELSPRQRVFCFDVTLDKCNHDSGGLARQKVIHQHLSTILMADFGVAPGLEGLNMAPRLPEGM